MKAILSGLAAALVLTSMSAAHAQEHSVQIKPLRTYHLAAEDFYDFKNTYLLENGDKLIFSARMNRFYAQLGDGERTQIYPVSRAAFVTAGGARIEFRDKGETVGVDNFEKLSLASGLPANTTMMAAASR